MRILPALLIAAWLTAPLAIAQGEDEESYSPGAAELETLFEDAEETVASLNPLENDLQNLEVAVQIPSEFRVRKDGATFDFNVKLADGSMAFDEHFVLAPDDSIDQASLSDSQVPGRDVYTYRLADADKPRMAAAYAKLQALRAVEDPTGQRALTFAISSNACIVDPSEAPETYVARTFARSDARVPFVPMSNDWTIPRDGSPDWLDFWNPCEAEG